MVYLLMITVLVGRRARRIILVVFAVLCIVLVGSVFPDKTASRLFAGSHTFLDDSVRIAGLDLSSANPNRGRTIAAYEIPICRDSD